MASHAVHAVAILLLPVLIVGSLALDGELPWSVGIAYVAYDTAILAYVNLQAISLWRRARPTAPASGRPSLTVIVAARDEAARLPGTLDRLLAQCRPGDAVIVVDDGSRDGTIDALRDRYGIDPGSPGCVARGVREPALGLLALPHGGKARALNAALPHVATELVLTVDADTRIDPGALDAMAHALAGDPGIVAATGVLRPTCRGGGTARAMAFLQTYEYVRNFMGRHAWERAGALILVSGAFAGYRTRDLAAAGGFDPDSLVEDYELTHRLIRSGYLAGGRPRAAVVPGATAATSAPGTVTAFLRQRRRWFGGFLQTQALYREMVANPRYGRLGAVMLPVKALDAVQPLYGLAALALAGWYAVTGRLDALGLIAAVVAGKLALDLAAQALLIAHHRRWVGPVATPSQAGGALAVVLEPFAFQPLRHLGAGLGWVAFLTRRHRWAG